MPGRFARGTIWPSAATTAPSSPRGGGSQIATAFDPIHRGTRCPSEHGPEAPPRRDNDVWNDGKRSLGIRPGEHAPAEHSRRCRARRRHRHRARRSGPGQRRRHLGVPDPERLQHCVQARHRSDQLRRLPGRRQQQDHHRSAGALHHLDVPRWQFGASPTWRVSTSSPSRTAPSVGTRSGSTCPTAPGSACSGSKRRITPLLASGSARAWSSPPRPQATTLASRSTEIAAKSSRATRTIIFPSESPPLATTA